MTLADAVKARALDLGFLACGITDPRPLADGERLDRWLAQGYAGVMRYLHRQARKRKDPRRIIPEAKTIVVVLDNYYDGQSDPGPVPRVARYARGKDYHGVTRGRLEPLAEFLRQQGAALAHTFVDSGPVPERALALRAGLGWIGKNTMLIRPGAGSFFFIGTVFTDLELDQDRAADFDHCGSCTRCLEACPTGALVEPRVLDATRCISYLTIEQRGAIPIALRSAIGNRIFGCDDCQLVCPWNKYAQISSEPDFAPRHGLDTARLVDLFGWSEAQWSAKTEGMALRRAGYEGWLRNVAVALGNAPPSNEVRAALAARASHASELVREHVAWALEQQRTKAVA
jgi:epoxyqueuosine reductase